MTYETNISKRNRLLAPEVIKNLEKRNFEGFYCEGKDDVIKKIISLIPKEETISWGGSKTLDEIGIKEYFEQNNYKTINRDKAKTKEKRRELIFEGLRADNFLMSANAISYDGEIVNIDGHGNRISALCWGPKKIIMVVGMNKLEKTLEEAISRARNYAAPINAQRVSSVFEVETPCINKGRCFDCKSETSICSHILITRLSYPKKRIKIILTNENLGY